VASGTYTITGMASAPTFSPAPGSSPARTLRDPAEAPPPRFAAPAPPRMEGRDDGRTIRSSAVAQSLLEEKSEMGAAPNNLANLQRVRKSDRGSMTAGSHDISRNITAEIPHAELSSPEAIPKAEPRRPVDSPAVQPVPGKPSSTGGSGIFEEPFQRGREEKVTLPNTLEKSPSSPSASRRVGFWRRHTMRFRPSIMFLVAVVLTTFGVLFVVFLIRLLVQITNWIKLYGR